ncbi:hypothetical protein CB1_000334009 [Camelus ferus]|nr:hypothetical protein CB1_000334009 [Camelus ferus]
MCCTHCAKSSDEKTMRSGGSSPLVCEGLVLGLLFLSPKNQCRGREWRREVDPGEKGAASEKAAAELEVPRSIPWPGGDASFQAVKRTPALGTGLMNGSKDNTLDMLGTDIWAANTFDSFSGATWDLQPEKLDFTQFHRKLRHTPKQPLPHIDREGCGKGKLEDGDGINLNDIEKVLPAWQGRHGRASKPVPGDTSSPSLGRVAGAVISVGAAQLRLQHESGLPFALSHVLTFGDQDPQPRGGHISAPCEQCMQMRDFYAGYHPMPHEVEIAHTKKLFRRRRNDRRWCSRATSWMLQGEQSRQQLLRPLSYD